MILVWQDSPIWNSLQVALTGVKAEDEHSGYDVCGKISEGPWHRISSSLLVYILCNINTYFVLLGTSNWKHSKNERQSLQPKEGERSRNCSVASSLLYSSGKNHPKMGRVIRLYLFKKSDGWCYSVQLWGLPWRHSGWGSENTVR